MRLGLAYSDVLLVPKRTPLNSRSEADVKTRFSKNIHLNIPLVSANMASVTEHKLAIAMARDGGIGIIHQFLNIEEQVAEVKLVKRSTSYIIENPRTVTPEITIKEAVTLMKEKKVTSLLVEENKKLIGIFTSRDYLFEEDYDKPIRAVMTPKEKLITAKPSIELDKAKQLLYENRIEKLPLVGDGFIKGLITTKDIKKLEYYPNAARDTKGRLLVAAAVGVKDTLERARALVDAGVDVIVVDIAHAHSNLVIQRVKELKAHYNVDVVVGNIATADAARDLIEAGADGLKIGIGPSPVCTTRVMSGAGVPQFTAILDVAEVARKYDIPVIADGGLSSPGDVVKAIAAGASTGMSGRLWVGCDESPGMIIFKDGKRHKKYYGSASYESNHKRKEKDAGKSIQNRQNVFVEGVSSLVDYAGPVSEVNQKYVKGIQSGLSYCGARNIQEMQANAEFIQITSAGWMESKSRGHKLSE